MPGIDGARLLFLSFGDIQLEDFVHALLQSGKICQVLCERKEGVCNVGLEVHRGHDDEIDLPDTKPQIKGQALRKPRPSEVHQVLLREVQDFLLSTWPGSPLEARKTVMTTLPRDSNPNLSSIFRSYTRAQFGHSYGHVLFAGDKGSVCLKSHTTHVFNTIFRCAVCRCAIWRMRHQII